MPNLIHAPTREVRSRIFDSARWTGYKPRPDDIIVATYPKCGTTWTQRIVAMLLSQSAEPAPILVPWPDMRLGPMSIEDVLAQAEAIPTRRQLKSHLPYDSLPIYEGVKFIHVARDGRDSAMSFHNHMFNFSDQAREGADAVSLADPKFASPMPQVPADQAIFFHQWLLEGFDASGDEGAGFWHMENSYWAARRDPNVLLVHFNDLKADRDGEMRRIAAFLNIKTPDAVWPAIVEAAGFDKMREQGETLMPFAGFAWQGGAKTFLYKGTNGRWRDVVSKDDLAAYDAKVKASFSPALARWIEHGREGGDPAKAPD